MPDSSSQPQAPPHTPGAPPIDPTRNVLDKVDDAVRRLDNLREKEAELIEAKIKGLWDLTEARLDAINREFALIESRRIEQKNDTKTAVDAALSAAERAVREQAAASEKAIVKSETGVAASSLQQAQTFAAQLRGVDTLLADTKDRVAKIENVRVGIDNLKTDQRQNIGMVVGVLGVLFGLAMLVITLVVATTGAG